MTPELAATIDGISSGTDHKGQRHQRASLTRSAGLTAVAALLDYAGQLVATLVVTPILVGALGRSLYGVWEMLRQSVTYMTATDGRPTDALRLTIANQQASADPATRRRYVGAALLVWVVFLPVMILGGGIIVWLAPRITKLEPALHGTVRLTAGLLVLSFFVATLAAIPEAVLRGMNLGYKRMGWQAGLSLVGGLMLAGAAVGGLGLWGLGAAHVTAAAVTGVCFWILVKRYVPSYGVARPARSEVNGLLHMSAWLTGGTVIGHLLASSDVLILGMVLSPAVVATYVLTNCAARTVLGVFDFALGAAMPGLGGVIGARQFERAGRIRGEIMALTWMFVTAAGVTILVCNRSFLSLWVGSQNYAGPWANLLLVCIAGQTAFIRSNQQIIDATLRPRPRVIVTAVAAVVTVAASLTLTPRFGIPGMCFGILLGRSTQLVAYPLLVATALGERRGVAIGPMLRPLAATIALFTVGVYLGERVLVHHWIAWCALVGASTTLAGGVAAVAGLAPGARRQMVERGFALLRAFRG